MNAIGLTNNGLEEIGVLEVKELIKAEASSTETVVHFSPKTKLDICRLTYRTQSMNRVAFLLFEFMAKDTFEETTDELKKGISGADLDEWLKSRLFRIECIRSGIHAYTSVDMEGATARLLNENGFKSDFDRPEVTVFMYILNEKGYFGIDFSGFDLSKRQYKVFNHPESLKGPTGYALVRLAGYDSKKTLLDPFMGSGVILIEAALFATGFPVQFFSKEKLQFTGFEFFKKYGKEKFFEKEDRFADKLFKIIGYDSQLRYLKATQKNAKLAGIEKSMSLSKCEIEWLDTKMPGKSIDLLVTDPPRLSKREEARTLKVYKEMFYQTEYIMKKGGKVVLLCRFIDEIRALAENHKLKIIAKHAIYQGKECLDVIIFGREK